MASAFPQFERHSNDLPRGYWRWDAAEDAELRSLKRSGARHKVIARQLGRTPASVNYRALLLKALDEAEAA